jgi:hypothetical protein
LFLKQIRTTTKIAFTFGALSLSTYIIYQTWQNNLNKADFSKPIKPGKINLVLIKNPSRYHFITSNKTVQLIRISDYNQSGIEKKLSLKDILLGLNNDSHAIKKLTCFLNNVSEDSNPTNSQHRTTKQLLNDFLIIFNEDLIQSTKVTSHTAGGQKYFDLHLVLNKAGRQRLFAQSKTHQHSTAILVVDHIAIGKFALTPAVFNSTLLLTNLTAKKLVNECAKVTQNKN